MKKTSIFFFVIFVAFVALPSVLLAGSKQKMEGWGINDPYNKLYSAQDVEKLKVVVVDVKKVIPLEGMSPAVALVVREKDGDEEILVHLCPLWYKKPNKIGIRKGDKLTLRGYFAEINDEEVIMAAKIKNKGKVFKVRLTSDGTPFWTMSPARIQKESSEE